MLPFLFGSLSKWLTSKKQAPRAERREQGLKARRQFKKLLLEALEERVTPVIGAHLFNGGTLIADYTGTAAIYNALNDISHVIPTNATGWHIDVDAGTYQKDFSVTGHNGLTIQSIAAPGTAIIEAQSVTAIVVDIDSANVTLRGFVIQDSGTPDATIGVNLTSNSVGSVLENNTIQFFRNSAVFERAVDINAGADNLDIRNNTFSENYWGIRFNSFALLNNVQVHNNFISSTYTTTPGPVSHAGTGIYIEPDSGSLVTSNKIFDNSITGIGTSVHSDSIATVDLSSNWWGTTSDTAIQSSFSGSGAFDFTPFLQFGTDTSASPGFQPDLSYLNVTTLGTQVGSTGRIQEGVNDIQDGSLTGGSRILNVLAGTYADNVNVNKALFLSGPNVGINVGTPPLGSRGPEAIIVPAVNNPSGGIVVTVSASNVTIDGFTVNGDNPTLVGLNPVNGIDVNANIGIGNNDAVISNLTVRNNLLKNFTGNGVLLGVSSGTQVLTGLSVLNNGIDNIALNGPTFYGMGIVFFNNAYGTIQNNALTRVRTGIQVDNFNLANSGPAASISGNSVTAYVRGIFYNLQYQSASPWTISNNTITAQAGSPAGNAGLDIYSIQDSVTSTISNNTISGFDFGIDAWNNPTTAGITILGGSVSNSLSYGLNLNNVDANYGDSTGTTNLTLNGVNFVNNPTALRVFDDPLNATGSIVHLGLSGVTLNGNTTGLLLSGSDAGLIGNTLANTSFIANSGNYVTLANGAYGSPFGYIDGTVATYNGVLGSGASLAQGFAIEDKIFHGTDAAGLGYVRITPNLVYVTTNSGSIQRGINVATAGDNIEVQAGTYKENLALNKSVNLVGPNSGLAGNAVRGAEAIVMTNGNQSAVITVTASNASIQGFLITGDDTSVTGSPVYSGADANALYAITNGNPASGTPINNVNVQNNIIQRTAIGFFGNSFNGVSDVLSTGNTIDSNLFQDIGVFDFGYAVSLRNDFNANITNNVMRRVYTGVIVNNNSMAAPGYRNVTGNDIQSYANGLWYNQAYSAATPLTVNNNTFTTSTTNYLLTPLAPVANNIGILVTGGPGFVGGTFTNNTISNQDFGVVVWGSDAPLTFGATNSITNPGVGVYVTNNVGFNPIGTTSLGLNLIASSNVTLNGLTITGAKNTGVWVRGDAGVTSSTVTLTGNTAISAGTTIATGVRLDGPNAALGGNSLGNTFFSGFTNSNNRFATLTNSAYTGPAEVDGTAATYNGVAGGNTLSLANAFSIEDKINDYLDINTAGSANVGFVRLRSGNVYVTQNSDSIQRGINVATAGDNIEVQAGTYKENIAINKSVNLVGPNSGLAGNAVRGAEAIVMTNGNQSAVITVTASNASIQGFLITGDDTSVAGGTLYSGADVNATYAITNGNTAGGTPINNVNVQNNIIQRTAIGFFGNSDSDPTAGYNPVLSTGNTIDSNLFQDIGVFDFGYAVSLRNDFNANVTNNVMRRVYTGVHVNNQSMAAPGFRNVTGNDIQSYANGLWYNQAYSAATPLTVNNNTFTTSTTNYLLAPLAPVANNIGILVTGGPGFVGGTFTNNSISNQDYGIVVWNTPTPLTFGSTNSITNAGVGVYVTNNVGFNPIGTTPLNLTPNSSDVTISGMTITGSTIAGVYARGDTGGGSSNVTVTNNTTINNGSHIGTGILLSGVNAIGIINNNLLSIHGNAIGIDVNAGSATITSNSIYDNTTGIRFTNGGTGSVSSNEFRDLTGFTANGTDLRLDSNAGAVTIGSNNNFGGGGNTLGQLTNPTGYFIDNRSSQAYNLVGSGNTFNWSNGSLWTALNTATLTDDYRIEDRVFHALDNSSSGLVTWVANNVYVSAPGTGLSDETIQRGVDASGPGHIVNVEAGTFAENVIVDQEVTIWGAGQGATIVVPSFDGANPGGAGSLPPGASSIFLVRSNNVTIRNLTADGHNPAPLFAYSNPPVNGVPIAARNGIITDHNNVTTVLNLNVHDVTVENIWLRGIYASTSFGTFNFSNNIVQNVEGDPNASVGIFNFGGSGIISGNTVSQTFDAISANWSAGTQFLNNIVTNSGSGVHTDNAGGFGGPSVPDLISGNQISSGTPGSYGIFVFVPYNAVQVNTNTVTNVDVGLGAYGGQGGSATFTGNNVDLASRASSLGAQITTYTFGYGPMTVSATLTGNTIKNAATLVQLQQEVGPVTAGLTLNGNTLDNTTTSLLNTVGVDVNGGTLTVGAGNQVLGTATGLQMSSAITPAALNGNTLSNLVFNGLTGNFITLNNGALGGQEIDGTGVTYNGVLGSSVTNAQGYSIEDRIQHAIDTATLGFIRVRSGNVYVTPNSFTSPNTTPSIQRAIDVASPTGDVVHVQGNTAGTPYTGGANTSTKSVTLDPGASPAQVFLNGSLTLDSNDTLNVEFTAPTTPGVTFDQWVVNGTVTLGGATLSAGSSSLANLGDEITLIANDLSDSVSGTFNGQPNGSIVTISGQNYVIFYNGGDGNDVTLTRVNLATPIVTYAADTAWNALTNGTFIPDADFNTPGLQPAVKGYDAFNTIQAAINAVANTGTTIVNAGTYVEDVTVNKSISLLGANAGINPNTGSRVAEAIIRPASSNPNPFTFYTPVVNITASNVTVDGFIVDGDNTSINSGVLVNGVDVDATDGIASYVGVSNITVQNNVIRNTSYTGLNFDNTNNLGAATSNNYLRDNKLTNIGHIPYGYGIGVLVYDNFYAQITGNVMTDVRVGVQTGNFYLANPGPSALIDSNVITSTRVGIYHNLAYQAASPFTITNNTVSVSNEAGGTRWFGIAVLSMQDSVSATISNNTVNAVGVTNQVKSGYFLWNDPTTNTITINGGSVTGADYGIRVTNVHPGFGDGASTNAIISGVSISNSSIAGVFVEDNPSNLNGATVSATITGNTAITGSPTGILVSGSDASANINNNLLSIHGNAIGIDVNAGSATITSNSIYDNTTGIRFTNGGTGSVNSNEFRDLTGFTANSTDLRIDNSAGAVTIGSNNNFGGGGNTLGQLTNPTGYFIDNRSSQAYNLVGSGNTFNWSNGSTWTALNTGVLTDDFRIEDRLYHAPDNASSGLIRVVANNVYVTQPGTGVNDESIQLAINAASAGDTVNLERGTYTLTSTVSVNKALTILGEGTTGPTATTVRNPTVNQNTFDFTGINAPAGTVNFQNFRVTDSGAVGIDYVVSQGPLGTLNLNGMLVENNKWNGLGIFGANATPLVGMNVNVTGSTFNSNGEQAGAASSLGNGDLIFFLYNGNANLTNVNVNGYATSGANNGIQFRGSDTPQAAGTVAFNNVNVTGSYQRPTAFSGGPGSGILIQNYTSVANVTFAGTVINLVDGIGLNASGLTTTLDLANTSINVGAGYFIASGVSVPQNNVPTNITATNTTLGGVAMSGATNAQYFAAEDRIGDRIDVPSTLPAQIGLVRLKAGNVFVTPNSFIAPYTTFADIQRGVDAANAGDNVWVEGGTYNNDVNINKQLSLLGSGYATTIIMGVIGGPFGSTITVNAAGVVVDGFTITRSGNNTTDWNNPALNSAGLSVQGQTNNVEVRNSDFTGNRTAIDINNSNGNYIHNNIIDNNRTGLIFRNQTENTTVTENFITNNWTMGVLFLDASGGTNSPVQSALNSTFFDNNISGNWYAQVVDRQSGGSLPAPGTTNLKDFSGNWFGTTTPVFTAANSTEPGYAAQIPVIFGGSAVPPGGQPDIAGPASANIDFTAYLWTGTDTSAAMGFQGDFSNLGVTTQGSQTQPVSRIQEGYNLLPAGGGTLHVFSGAYAGNVTTGAKPTTIELTPNAPATTAQVTIGGSLTLTPATTIHFNLNGPNTITPVGGTDYDQIVVTGSTNVGGATFNLTKNPGYFPALGANFALIRSTGGNTPSFNYGGTVAENAVIAVSGIPFQVNYNVSGTDLNLKVIIPNNIVYVWNGWSGQSVGDYYQPAPPVNTLLTPPGGYITFSGTPVTYGYNAYSTIQDAINAVTSGGIIRVYTGTYAQDITVPNGKNNLQIDAWGAAGTRTINGVAGGPSATVTLDGTGTVFAGNAPGDNFVVYQTASDNLAGIRTVTGALGSTISYVSVSGSDNTTAFTGVDVGAGTWVSYSNGSITNYRTGIKVNNGAGSAANPVDIQTSTINGSGWASLTVMPAGVDVGLNGFARITNNNVISGNRWGVRVLGGTAMLQGNNLSNNNWTSASAAGLFVANGGVVDAGQVIDGSQANYTGLGISTGGNNFASGYSMGGAQAIVNLNANFGGPPSGPGNLTDGTSISARNNDFGTTVYGNIERIVNHAIDNPFQGYVDYRNAVGAVAPTQEGATSYYAVSPVGEISQRSIIRGIQFVINSPVTLGANAIDLIRADFSTSANPGQQAANITLLNAWYGAGNHTSGSMLSSGALNISSSVNGTTGRTTITLTFNSGGFVEAGGSLKDGFYNRIINQNLVDLLFSNSGMKLAPTIDPQFHRLFGDTNGDQVVSGSDISRSNDAFNVIGSLWTNYFDWNANGVTNTAGIADSVDLTQFNIRRNRRLF